MIACQDSYIHTAVPLYFAYCAIHTRNVYRVVSTTSHVIAVIALTTSKEIRSPLNLSRVVSHPRIFFWGGGGGGGGVSTHTPTNHLLLELLLEPLPSLRGLE